MKPIGLLLLAIALLLTSPDGVGSKTPLAVLGFRVWVWIGLALTVWIIWICWQNSHKHHE